MNTHEFKLNASITIR